MYSTLENMKEKSTVLQLECKLKLAQAISLLSSYSINKNIYNDTERESR
jgi:hypothetical protein